MFTSYIVLFLSLMRAESAEAARPTIEAPTLEAPVAQKVAPKVIRRKLVEPTPAATPVSAPVEIAAPIALTMSMAPMLKVAVPATADAIVKEVQNYYTQTKSFSATFQQTVKNQTFNKTKPVVSQGKVYILKPGKMRWDYQNKSRKQASDPKVSKSFISDGKHLWAIMHKNKQYYKEDLQGSTLPVALSFLMGTGDLRKDFDVALDTAGKYGSKSDILLVLTPKMPSARYKKLWLVVDPADYSVKQSIVLNTKNDTNSIRFLSVKTNDGTVKPGHFIFNAKAHKDFKLVTAPSTDAP